MPDKPKTVLLVEDEDNIALALEFLIDRQGHALTRVSSGEGALAQLGQAPPDLVILDVMLPNASGYEVCQFIKENEALSGTKVLMMSAAGSLAERKGLALGADAFFVKPFDTKQLTHTIAQLLEDRDVA